MKHVAIVAWTAANRVAKFMDFDEPSGARAHVERVKERWPDAFAAVAPKGDPADWLVDPVTKTLTVEPIPTPPPDLDAIYERHMKNHIIKALVLALNDGTFVPGARLASDQLKKTIRAKM